MVIDEMAKAVSIKRNKWHQLSAGSGRRKSVGGRKTRISGRGRRMGGRNNAALSREKRKQSGKRASVSEKRSNRDEYGGAIKLSKRRMAERAAKASKKLKTRSIWRLLLGERKAHPVSALARLTSPA